MLELLFIVVSFLVGKKIGADQSNSVLDRSNIDELEFKILDAQNEAETWKRRYNKLLLNTQTSKEQE
jgi:hypothetical protein